MGLKKKMIRRATGRVWADARGESSRRMNGAAISPAPTVRMNRRRSSFGITSTRIAEELGRRLVQNSVMLGFFGAVSDIAKKESLAKAVEQCVPAGTEELNLKAFNAGWDYFEQNYGEAKAGKRKAAKATGK